MREGSVDERRVSVYDNVESVVSKPAVVEMIL